MWVSKDAKNIEIFKLHFGTTNFGAFYPSNLRSILHHRSKNRHLKVGSIVLSICRFTPPHITGWGSRDPSGQHWFFSHRSFLRVQNMDVEMSFLRWPYNNLFSQCSLWHLGIWTDSRNHKAQLMFMDMSSSFCSEWSSSFLPTLSPTYQDRIQDCPLDMGQPSKFAATVSSTGFGSTKTRTKREYKSWKRTSLLDLKINLPWISDMAPDMAFFPVVFLIALCGSTVHEVKSVAWMVNWCNHYRIETRQSLPSSTLDCGHQCPWHSHLRFGVWLRRFLQAKMANTHTNAETYGSSNVSKLN